MQRRFPLGHALVLEELERDPYPVLAAMREREPVSYVGALGIWFVTRYDLSREILHDVESFVVGTSESLVQDIFGTHMMTLEGEQHRRQRAAHQAFFMPPSVRGILEPRIKVLADGLIDAFLDAGKVELREHFSSRLPVQTMISLFGLDPAEEPVLRRLYDDFEMALANFTWDEQVRSRGKAAAAEFHQLIGRYLQSLRSRDLSDDDSLLSALIKAGDLSGEEITHNAIIIFFGGISTVDALILNTLYALERHPDAKAEILEDRSLLPHAINETVRWQGPVQSATRHVVREVQVGEVSLKPGDTVNCMLAAANRDPAVFDSPDQFDLHRADTSRHMGFATGPHHCLGSHLARAEARIAIEQLLQRLPGFSLDLDRVDGPVGYEFRQPRSAVAMWNP